MADGREEDIVASKYYAVKKGRQTGIFRTWAECQAQIQGFSGGVYKSFETQEEAEEFMSITMGAKQDENFTDEYISSLIASRDTITAFVDGSYDDAKKQYSFGLAAMGMGKAFTDCCADFEPMSVGMRNVGGEILGATEAMELALNEGAKKLAIYFDYEGIEKWATGMWKRNKTATQQYKAYFDSIKDRLEVEFHKVDGHSGIVFNEIADRLAKDALDMPYDEVAYPRPFADALKKNQMAEP